MWNRITQTVVSITSVGTLMVAIYVAFAVNEVHVTFNSQMDKYIKLVQKSSKAEGVKEEKGRDKIPD